MKIFEGISMSDEFYKYAVYKKEIGEILEVNVTLDESGALVANEYPISDNELINIQIYNLTKQLKKTDYIDNKLTEAVSKYIVTGDSSEVLALREKYAVELANREDWRKEISSLKEKLKNL